MKRGAGSLKELIKLINPLVQLVKKEKRKDSNKIANAEERSQTTPQKYKQLYESIMKNYISTNWAIWKKWINPRNIQTMKTDTGR